jgi:lysophospholipase L1-like esterase
MHIVAEKIRYILLLTGLLVFGFVCIAMFDKSVTADQETTWLDANDAPYVANGETKSHNEYFADTASSGVAVETDCKNRTYQSELSYEISGCWAHAEGISITDGGGTAIKLSGDPYAYYTRLDGKIYLATNGTHLFQWIIEEGSAELRIYKIDTIQFSRVYDEEHYFVEYEITSSADRVLSYEFDTPGWGPLYDSMYSTSFFSENGSWLAIWQTEGIVTVINMENLTMQTIRARPAPGDYFASLAISDDGRYLAGVVYEDEGRPWVYDLVECNIEPVTYISDGNTCDARQLGPHLEVAGAYDGDLRFPVTLNFYDINTLGFYTSAPNGSEEYWEYIIQAPGTSGQTNYVALGDSFASGEGAGMYFPATDWPNTNDCHLSKRSYPYLFGEYFELDSANSIACSGARIKNIIGPELVDNEVKDKRRTNQHHDVEEQMGFWAPGYKLQQSFVNQEVDIVTISVSGNDIGFGDIIGACVAPGTCFEGVNARVALVATMNEQFERLVDTYTSTKSSMRPGSRVYAVGYPEIIEPYNNPCIGGDVHMNMQEKKFAQSVTQYLNYIVELASKRAGVTYINVADVFYGKRLCESTAPAVHGLRTAQRWPPFSVESYHPTREGQRLIAQAIAERTNNLTALMPRVNLTTEVVWGGPAAVQYGMLTAEEAAERGHEVYDEVIDFAYPPDQTVARAEVYTSSMQSDEFLLIPGAGYELWMASEPVYLGTFYANEQRVVEFDVVIPGDTPPGQHTFHLRGPTVDGRNIDIRQPVYVVASTDDWDGDGVLNEDAPCYIALPRDDGSLDYEWCENKRATAHFLFPVGRSVGGDALRLSTRPEGRADITTTTRYWPVGSSQLPVYPRQLERNDEVHSNEPHAIEKTWRSVLAVFVVMSISAAGLLFYKHKRR